MPAGSGSADDVRPRHPEAFTRWAYVLGPGYGGRSAGHSVFVTPWKLKGAKICKRREIATTDGRRQTTRSRSNRDGRAR